MAGEEPSMYVGFDFSTQQIKVLAMNDELQVVQEEAVRFDTDLPKYKTHGGVHIHKDKVTVTAPTLMWVEALDILLDRMKSANFPFHRVVAISGAAQQNTSVYWKKGARQMLKSLQPSKTLKDQLQDAFSVPECPNWMDASTTAQCRQLEKKVGGAEKLAEITGSRGYERFTGNEIRKIYQQHPDDYNNTEKISLVSNFAASLMIGDYAPIDDSDGSGMNLLDIRKRDWSDLCLDACAPGLREKLGTVVPSKQVVGTVSSYLSSRCGFPQDCEVIAFTGDNNASLAGFAPKLDDVIVSLGTSDTVIFWLKTLSPKLEGHIFANPVFTEDYMGLMGFKNGSLTRERIRDERSGGSWDTFDQQLSSTPMGNNGNIGIYFDEVEIQPLVQGVFRFNEQGQQVGSFSDEVEVRAVIEGQCMALRIHTENLGFVIGPQTRVLATGGASSNQFILQVIADVFNAPVLIKDVTDSAALGCAFRAKHGMLGGQASFSQVVEKCAEPVCVARPTPGADKIYPVLCQRYQQLEAMVERKYGQS